MWSCPLCSPRWPHQAHRGPSGLRGSVTTGWAYGDSLRPSLDFSGSSAGEGALAACPVGMGGVRRGWGQGQPEAWGLAGGPVTLLAFPCSPTSCFGVGSPQEEGLAWEEPVAPRDVFSGPARCPAPYTFSFEMLVTGPCLLAGGCLWPGLPSRVHPFPPRTADGTLIQGLGVGETWDRKEDGHRSHAAVGASPGALGHSLCLINYVTHLLSTLCTDGESS